MNTQVNLPDTEVLDKMLSKTKIKLFYKKGAVFLSSLFSNLTFEWDETIPTACTDGQNIRWNPHFFFRLDYETRVFVLAHELWHIAYQHPFRINGRDPQIANIVMDHIVNTKLLKDGYTVSKLGFEICKDFKYHEWGFERAYEDFIKNLPPPPPPPPMGSPSGGTGNTPEPDGKGPKPSEGGLHSDVEGGDPKDEQSAMGNLIRAVTASKLAKEAGVIPGEIEQIINEYLNPVLPWDILLQQWCNEMSRDDYSYRRPNRRFEDPLLPSLWDEGRLQEMNWYVDVSGSITDFMIKRFFSEMVYVHTTFLPYKINIIQFDTRITKVTELTDDEDFKELKITGRGGTSLHPVHDHIVKTNPSAAIIFSDMECNGMNDPNIPILWCIFCENGKTPSSYSWKPTFGQVINVVEK